MEYVPTSAPNVEPALAEPARREDAAVASGIAPQSEAVLVDAAPRVEPCSISAYQQEQQETLRKQQQQQQQNDNEGNEKMKNKKFTLTLQSLRGTSGSTFESYAAVLRGAPPKNCFKTWMPCLFDERDFIAFGEVKKYVVLKGSSCFVFLEHALEQASPLYAIPLEDVYAIAEDPHRPDPGSMTVSPPTTTATNVHYVTILFKYKETNEQAYQFTFDTSNDSSVAKRFLDVVERITQQQQQQQQQEEHYYQSKEQRKEGGGAVVSASILHTDRLAQKAANHQPEI